MFPECIPIAYLDTLHMKKALGELNLQGLKFKLNKSSLSISSDNRFRQSDRACKR